MQASFGPMDTSGIEQNPGSVCLRSEDLLRLLSMEPTHVLGAVLELNRTPRYHNSLNAIILAGQVLELQQKASMPSA